MQDKIQKWSVLLFSGIFLMVWCWLLVVVTASFMESKKICILTTVILVLFLLAVLGMRKFLVGLWEDERFWLISSALIMLFMLAGLLYAGMSLRVNPSWDFGAVYQGAVEIAERGALSEQSSWYFTTYPNNVAVCIFLAVCFKVLGGICSYLTLGVLLNVLMIAGGIFFFFLLVRYLYGVRSACLGLLACALFFPFYMHAPIFYTDTFALPFVTGTFLLYQLRKKDSRYLLITSLILGMGYKVKGSLGVILIALLIHIWLQKDKMSERIKQSLFLVFPFLLFAGLLTLLLEHTSILDTTQAQKNEFPLEHWVAMGLEGSGGYSADVYWLTASVEGKEEKRIVDRAFIKKKLEDYGASGLAEHLKWKTVFTWGDGTYFAPEKLKREPLQESLLHSWVLYFGENYTKTYFYCSIMQLILLLGIFGSVLCNICEREKNREAQAMQISVFGLFLFLLIWETRSRYLINFVPIFVCLGIDFICELDKYLLKRYAFTKHLL